MGKRHRILTETIRVGKNGERLYPPIKVGYERLNRHSDEIAEVGFVICEEHSTSKSVFVRNNGALHKCCEACILAHCHTTAAVPDLAHPLVRRLPDGSLAVGKWSEMDLMDD